MTQLATSEQHAIDEVLFAATCSRLNEYLAYLDLVVGVPTEDGWIAATDFAAAASPARTEMMQRIAAAN